MSTLTKEWLQKTIAELEEERDAVPGVVNEDAARALAAMKLALASLEAEHAGFIVKHKVTGKFGSWLHSKADWFRSDEYEVLSAYTAPPAPASVPDEEQCKPHPVMAVKGELGFLDHFDRIISERDEDIDIGQLGSSNYEALMLAALDAFRAAMLQGAEPVTTAYKLPFEQWLSQQTGTIDVECGCVMTEVFFHWLRVAYEAGNSPVIPDGWVMLPAEPTQAMMNAWLSEVANWRGHAAGYRAMVAAAPQQEVK